jgi:hypothetical protein
MGRIFTAGVVGENRFPWSQRGEAGRPLGVLTLWGMPHFPASEIGSPDIGSLSEERRPPGLPLREFREIAKKTQPSAFWRGLKHPI